METPTLSRCNFWLSGWTRKAKKHENETEEFCGKQTASWKWCESMVRLDRATQRMMDSQ